MIAGEYAPGRTGRGREAGPAVDVRGRDVRVDRRDRVDRREDAAADRGAAAGREALDRGEEVVRSVGRLLDDRRQRAERDDPDLGAGGHAAHERRRRVLRGPQPGRVDVVEHMLPDTSSASRIVVWFAGTHRTATGRASATASAATGDGEQRERHVAPPAAPRRPGGERAATGWSSARPAAAGGAAAPRVQGDERRHEQERHEQLGPQERHWQASRSRASESPDAGEQQHEPERARRARSAPRPRRGTTSARASWS